MLSDVEISRSLNALATTLRDQRPERFDARRAEEIVTGALGGEHKLGAFALSASAGELRRADDDRLIATVQLRDGQWSVDRKVCAGESDWALPQPAHDEKKGKPDAG